ncbi:MAG: HEAT repeat domain-containing protein [Planctomycetota bacterium]
MDDRAAIIVIRQMMRSFAALTVGAALAACAHPQDQVWSTKSQSLWAQGAPALNVGTLPTAEAVEGDLRDAALALLRQAADSSNALLRANAIEALHHAPDQLEPIVRQALLDENRGVRFVAAMTIGRLRMESIAHLLEPLLRDESQSVRAAAIYGLRACGYPADLNPLAEMIRSDDPEVKANAAMVLGELGNASAVPMIQEAVGKGLHGVPAARAKIVELQLAEALVKLGVRSELEVIRAALFTPVEQGELTALACQMCGRLNDRRVVPDLLRLALRTGERSQPAEVRLAATLAVAQIEPGQAPLEVPRGYVGSDRYEVRAQAALTLGGIGDPATLPTLTSLLSDENPLVQVAAAGAILQIQRL